LAKKNKIFIRQPSKEELEKFPPAVRDLVKKGRSQGFITQQELLKAFPDAEENVILLDEVFELFMSIGVEVIDVKNSLIWEKKKEEEILQQSRKKSKNEEPPAKSEVDEDFEVDLDADADEEENKKDDDDFVDEEEKDPESVLKKNANVDLSEISNDSVRMYLSEIGRT